MPITAPDNLSAPDPIPNPSEQNRALLERLASKAMPVEAGVDALHRVQAVSRHFHGFDEHEVRRLATAMSIVEFREG